MSDDVIISVENLGKRYRLGTGRGNQRYTALRDVIADKARFLFRRTDLTSDLRPPASSDFWALENVSFEVKRGEVLGIIGRNGAGKSTLLKILSRITDPTKGRVRLKGRVASLLEVGTGFHPELTGRENIFLNGAVLGMTRAEIKSKFDEIVAFAEVERFLDTPVKRYSSGMYVRLAFAVAAHLEPEILVVDEVLAVGDAAFQKKCLNKMHDVATQSHRTVLFVSHNMTAVRSLCTRAMYLENGRVAGLGQTANQIQTYLSEGLASDGGAVDFPRQLSPEITLERFSSMPRSVAAGGNVHLSIRIGSKKRNKAHDLALLLYSQEGVRLGVVDLRFQSIDFSIAPGDPLQLEGGIGCPRLVEGSYYWGMYLVCGDFSGDVLELARFEVVPSGEDEKGSQYPASVRGFLELKYHFSNGGGEIHRGHSDDR